MESLEDAVLNAVAVAQALALLDAEEPREVLRLLFGLWVPDDWPFPGPATLPLVGIYIGMKYRGRPLAEASVRLVRDRALRQLHQRMHTEPTPWGYREPG
jgi:RimJ/RimL family protein N-acetyltransferase